MRTDPINIAVQIVEDTKQGIDALKKKIEAIDGMAVKVKVQAEGGIDFSKIQGELDKKKLSVNLDASDAKNVTADYSKLNDVLTKLSQQLENVGASLKSEQWGKMSQSTQEAITAINKLVEALNTLDTKFAKTMGKSMGTAFAKEMKKSADEAKQAADGMNASTTALSRNLSQTTSNANACVSALNNFSESSRRAGSSTNGFVESLASMDQAGKTIARIDKMLAEVGKRLNASNLLGFDTGYLRELQNMLTETRSKFMQVFEGKGFANIQGLGFMDARSLSRETLLGTTMQTTRNELKAVDEVSNAMERLFQLRKAFEGLGPNNALGINNEQIVGYISQIDSLIAKMQQMSRLEASTFVNSGLESQIGKYETVIAAQMNAEKAVTKEKEQSAQEQKRLLAEIQADEETFNRMRIQAAKEVANAERQEQQKAHAERQKELEEAFKPYLQQIDESRKKALQMMDEIAKAQANFGNAVKNGTAAGIDASWLGNLEYDAKRLSRVVAVMNELQSIASTGKTKGGLLAGDYAQTKEYTNALSAYATRAQTVNQAIEEKKQKEKEDAEELARLTQSSKDAGVALTRLQVVYDALAKSINEARSGNYLHNTDTDVENTLAKLRAVLDMLRQINSSGSASGQYFSDFKRSEDFITFRTQASAAQKDLANAQKEATKEAENEARAQQLLSKSLDNIRKSKVGLEAWYDRLKSIGASSTSLYAVQHAIDELVRAQERLKAMSPKDLGYYFFGGGSGITDLHTIMTNASIAQTQAVRDYHLQVEENRKAARAKHESAAASQQLSVEEQKLAKAIQSSTQSAREQSAVLGDLKSMVMQYLSVWGATSFVKEMAQITGELELQQKSLEVIIGSASTASELFAEIRDLSQQSPYTFQDLLKSTRQLAAFGIQTKDLYGTMKALSDIGAGLSVDVQRLILAYGHTKSYGYLSGIQNRQFETAGIDLVGALADRYNRLADAEEKAGRAAEHVTRKDVFKKISKKEVGFEDVNAVIMGLDQPGGRFYNMQERQFETLGGKLRNLRNNYNIMMSEMGSASGGLLKGTVNALNELTGNWEKYGKIIASILIPIGAMRLAQMTLGTAIGSQTKAMSKNIMMMVRSEKAMAAMNATYKRGFWASFGAGWGTKTAAYNPNRQDALAFRGALSRGLEQGTLSKTNLMMMGVSKDLPQRYRAIALSLSGVDKAQIRAMASANRLNRAWLKAKIGAVAFGQSLRTAFAATLANPYMWIMAALSGIMAIFSHFLSQTQKVESALDSLKDHAKNDSTEIQKLLNNYAGRGVNLQGQRTYVNGNEIVRNNMQREGAFDDDLLKQMNLDAELEELKQKLQTYSPFYDGDLIDINKMGSQLEQFKEIVRLLESYRHSNDVLQANASDYQDAATWGWGYESVIENMNDYNKALKRIHETVKGLSEEDLANYDKLLGGSLSDMVSSGAAADMESAIERYFVNVFSMNPDARQKIYQSWDDGLKGLFNDATSGKWYQVGDAFTRQGDLKQSFSRLGEEVSSDIRTNFEGDADAAINYAYLVFQEFAGKVKNLSDVSRESMLNLFVKSVFGSDDNTKNIIQQFREKQFKDEVGKALGGKGLSPIMDKKEAMKIVNETINETIKKWKQAGREMSGITKTTFRDIQKSTNESIFFKTGWQNRLIGKGSGADRDIYKRFAAQFKKEIESSSSELDLFEAVKKKFDELKKKVLTEKLHLKKTFKIDINPEVTFGSLEGLKKLAKQMNEGNLFYRDSNGAIKVSHKYAGKNYQNVSERDLPIYQNIMNMITAAETMDKEQYNIYKDDTKKDKSSSSSKAYKDEYAKRWDERIRVMKEAYDWYDKWEKRIGRKGAIDKVNERYNDIFKTWRNDKLLPFNFNVNEIQDYVKYIREIQKLAETRYRSQMNDTSKNRGEESLRVFRRATDLLADIDSDEFDKRAEKFASALSRALDNLTRQWEIFESVRNATGNLGLASSMGGFGGYSSPFALSDLQRAKLTEQAGTSLDFARVLGMSEEQIQEYVESLGIFEGKGEKVQEIIKGIVDGLKQWQKTRLDEQKADIDTYAKAVGSLVDYISQRNKLEDEYNKIVEANNRLVKDGFITQQQANAANRAARANTNYRQMQLTSGYQNFYGSALGMAKRDFKAEADAIAISLGNMLKTRNMTPDQYAQEMAKLAKARSEYGTSGFLGMRGAVGQFIAGGSQGLRAYYEQRRDAARRSGNEEEAKRFQRFIDSMDKASDAVNDVIAAFNTLKQGMDLLGGMFDALGMEGTANAIGDASQVLGGALSGAQALSAFGPWGAAAGAGIGLVTGLAQVHDARLERAIQDLRTDVQKIDNTLNVIRSLRERSLGYDQGMLRRLMVSMYAGNGTDAGKAMMDFYNRGVSGRSNGYVQELEMLKAQREDYLKMYDAENDKKKSSEEALDEYRSKIAELDEQIMFFAEDLANELYGIDFKSWADQIGDSLMTAFENGTSALEAFETSVRDIMRNVVKNMIVTGILEPQFKKLREMLFGENGTFDVNNPQSVGQTIEAISKFFSQEMQPLLTASKELYNGVNNEMKQLLGFGLDENGGTSSRNLSNSISSTASEETMGVVAGYLARMSQDLSVVRIIKTQFVNESWPSYIEMVTSANTSLANIDRSAARIMQMLDEGSGAMYDAVYSIRRRVDNITTGVDRVYIK